MRARHLASLAVVGLVGLFTLSGCAPYFKGEGAIPSLVAGEKAVFSFTFEGPKKKFKGVYDDQGTGTFFYFQGLVSWVDSPGVRDECMQAVARYRSKIKSKRGEGDVQITACDNGNPGADPTRPKDQLFIQMLSGPLMLSGPGDTQYVNGGDLISGNLVASNRPFNFKEGDDRDDDRGDHDGKGEGNKSRR